MGNTWKNMVLWCFLLSLQYFSRSWLGSPSLRPTMLRMPPQGQLTGAQFLMIWLVIYGIFRVTPLGSCSFREVTELSWELDTMRGSRELWTRQSWGPISQGPLRSLRQRRLALPWKRSPARPREHWVLPCLILIAEATPQSSYCPKIQGCPSELLDWETACLRQGDSTSSSSQGWLG